MSVNSISAASKFEVRWLLLAIVAYSYPLAALFGDSDGSVSIASLPTIFALAISAAIGFFKYPGKYRNYVLLIFLCIFIFNTAIWTTVSYTDPHKMIVFNGVLLIFGLMLALSFGVPQLLDNMDRALMILGGIALLLSLTNISEFSAGRLTYGNSNPIWMGRLFGISSVATLYAMFKGRVRPLIAIILLVPLLGAMTLTGSRGPVFAFLIASTVGFLVSPIKNKYAIIAGMSLFAGIVLLIVILVGGYGNVRGLSFGQTDDVSYFIRLNMFEYTKIIIRDFPDGIGVGNFSFMNFTYPHNIVLEFLVEWGRIPGGAYILLFVIGGMCLYFAGDKFRLLLILMIFEMVNACLSGDITSPRLLYGLVVAGIAYVLAGRRKRDNPTRRVALSS